MDNKILEIKNLKALVSETGEEILSGIDLEIGDGETHVIMGPNGGGKSTLVNELLHPALNHSLGLKVPFPKDRDFDKEWYTWRLTNWGTKWSAADTIITFNCSKCIPSINWS